MTITKASMHSKYPGTASHMSCKSRSILDYKLKSQRGVNAPPPDVFSHPGSIKEENEVQGMGMDLYLMFI